MKTSQSYKPKPFANTTIKANKSTEGETIEQKFQRILNNKEPIKDGAPLIYTDRKEGVKAGYNIRADRFEIALEATDKIAKSINARREEKAKMNVVKDGENGEPESTQGTK